MSEQTGEALLAYQAAVNRIDDYFEYSSESMKDRAFVYNQLSILTDKLKAMQSAIARG